MCMSIELEGCTFNGPSRMRQSLRGVSGGARSPRATTDRRADALRGATRRPSRPPLLGVGAGGIRPLRGKRPRHRRLPGRDWSPNLAVAAGFGASVRRRMARHAAITSTAQVEASLVKPCTNSRPGSSFARGYLLRAAGPAAAPLALASVSVAPGRGPRPSDDTPEDR